jgi:hypothetical protein
MTPTFGGLHSREVRPFAALFHGREDAVSQGLSIVTMSILYALRGISGYSGGESATHTSQYFGRNRAEKLHHLQRELLPKNIAHAEKPQGFGPKHEGVSFGEKGNNHRHS